MKGLNDLLETYLAYFKGREDYFACQGRDYYYPVKGSLNENYLQKHLSQFTTFGVYVLTSDNKCNFICVDIDIPKNELENIDFKNPTRKFHYLRNKLLHILKVFKEEFHIPDNSILLEDTGGRGYHIWLFFSSPLQGDDAVKFYQICKSFIDFDFEFFPKQPNINEKRKLGNLIKLPLGTHQKYDSKSLFFQLLNGEIKFINSLDDNLHYLTKIKKMDPEIIDRIIDKYSERFNNNEIEKIDSGKFTLKERILYRKREIKILEERLQTKRSEFIILYGRRRVGKTELLRRLIRDYPHIYYMADQRNAIGQLEIISWLLCEHFHDEYISSNPLRNWDQFFSYLRTKDFGDQKLLLIIDEFPYLVRI